MKKWLTAVFLTWILWIDATIWTAGKRKSLHEPQSEFDARDECAQMIVPRAEKFMLAFQASRIISHEYNSQSGVYEIEMASLREKAKIKIFCREDDD